MGSRRTMEDTATRHPAGMMANIEAVVSLIATQAGRAS